MRGPGHDRGIGLALAAAAAAALAVAPAAGAKAGGFKYGVAAGDVSGRSAILWAKAKRSGLAEIQVTRRGDFDRCDPEAAPKRLTAKARRRDDRTVQKRVGKLDPGTEYRYRFCMDGGRHSDTGKFKTAPRHGRGKTIRFALAGDQDARPEPGQSSPYWNDFEVWKQIRRQRNDFNVLLGDTIYSDTEVPGYGLDDVATTVKKKWRAYRLNLGQKQWTKTRGSSAYYAHWDDHEFINDFSRFESSFPLGVGDVQIDGQQLYERGVKAFRDYNPVAYRRQTGLYRSARWGHNLEIFFLDERSFRSAGSDYQGQCDNPPGSGDPDLAPTAPQRTRNSFSAVAPQLSDPPPPACVASIKDPSRTMLGEAQLARFERAIADSKATFKVIFNEVPIQQFYALPYDRWEGYEAERQALLTYLRDNVDNVVFMTTDVHANLVNDARLQTLEDGGPVDTGILDVTTGPVATASYSLEIDQAIGSESGGTLIHDAFFKPPPPDGVGMQCAATDVFSYAEARVTKSELTIDLLDAGGAPVQDSGDRDTPAPPCAQIVIPAA